MATNERDPLKHQRPPVYNDQLDLTGAVPIKWDDDPPPSYPYSDSIAITQNIENKLSAPVIESKAEEDLSDWRATAVVCSISSLLLTCCCWFSVPAILLSCRVVNHEEKQNYKAAIVLSAIAFILTALWITIVIIYGLESSDGKSESSNSGVINFTFPPME